MGDGEIAAVYESTCLLFMLLCVVQVRRIEWMLLFICWVQCAR